MLANVKWWRIFVIAGLALAFSGGAWADTLSEYQDARQVYIDVAACMAAYNNSHGSAAQIALGQEGWQIQYFHVQQPLADAKFVFMKRKDAVSGQTEYLLAVAGTESEKDVRTDMRFDQVCYGGGTVEEFAAKAQEVQKGEDVPRVHRGFHQVVQAAFTADVLEGPGEEYFKDYLLKNPGQKIILTGHSLGGAAAVLAGARLLDMGVRPEQIQIVTFGAPAVGNAAFTKRLEGKLNVTRYVMKGDQITSILQDLVGGYMQTGQLVKWEQPEHNVIHPHHIQVYLDRAAREYYGKRGLAEEAGLVRFPDKSDEGTGAFVYAAPLKNSLPEGLRQDYGMMATVVKDGYRDMFPRYILASGDEDMKTSMKNAAAAGCRWLVAGDLQGMLLKNKNDTYYVTLQQSVYSVPDGRLVDERNFGSATSRWTALGAVIYHARMLRSQPPFSLKSK